MTAPAQLAVCIPTYKRPEQLRRCVESVIRAAGSHEVPIHVADDSSDDTNVAVLSGLRARYPKLFHHRNPENLGIDRNILNAVDRCEARHAWILGEDDRLTPAAISRVRAVLEVAERPFVFVNYASVDQDVAWVLTERALAIDSDLEKTAEEFLAEDAWAMGFIGACVVDTALWRRVRPDPYLGTYYAHVGRIMESMRGKRVYLLAEPLVLNRCGAPGAFTWAGSTFEVLHGWARMVDLLPGYAADCRAGAKASFARAHRLGSLAFFAYLRADRALEPGAWERHVREGPYTPAQRAAAWAIARTPTALFRAARWGLAKVRRPRLRRLSGY